MAPPAVTGLRVYANLFGTFTDLTGGRVSTSGGEFQVQARAALENGEEILVPIALEWTSSNQNVATVSNSGVVTPVGVGQARISTTFLDYEAGLTVDVQDE